MGENIAPMECSDPQYQPGYALDYADDNIVRDNVFQNVTYGVRVEDDDNQILNNQFAGDGAQQAIVVGTPIPHRRARPAGRPARSSPAIPPPSPPIPNPYRWVHGHTNTTFSNNLSLGRPSGLCEGLAAGARSVRHDRRLRRRRRNHPWIRRRRWRSPVRWARAPWRAPAA